MIVSKEAASKALMLSAEPKGFSQLQSKLLSSIKTLELPKANEELWRYTKPDLFDWSLLETPLEGARCELLNSREPLPETVRLRSGKNLTLEDAELLEKVLCDFGDDTPASSLTNALTALSTEVHVLEIDKRADVEEPLELEYTAPEGRGFFAPLFLVRFLSGCRASVVIRFQGGGSSMVAPRVEVVAEDQACGEVVSLNNCSSSAQIMLRERIHAKRDATVDLVSVNLGGGVVRQDIDCYLHATGGNVHVSSVAYTSGRQHFGLFTNQHHLVPHCSSDLYAKTVLADRSRSVYFGYIRVAEKAHQTDAYQTNRNLVLSKDARADAIPNLEIKANDVKCSHGASVGQVSEEELFYLQARGIPQAEAERLLVQGFLADILLRIKRDKICEEVMELVFRRADCGV